MVEAELSQIVARMLQWPEGAGLPQLQALSGGGNNRVYTVEGDGRRYVVKAYFHDPADTRDRLGHEYAFLDYAQQAGVTGVPQVVAADPASHVGIYEYIDGRKLASEELTREHVLAAAQLIANLNGPARGDSQLPLASDAGFSISEHINAVDHRFARLAGLHSEDHALQAGLNRLVSAMTQAWRALRGELATPEDTPLTSQQRCISPSDFGFHNALLKADGQLTFIDFEYAGWDDPAKMIGDFFCQPAVPVPLIFFDAFAEQALVWASPPHGEMLRERARRLLPLMRLKWSCIMLNEFLPESARRRQFAHGGNDADERRRAQLAKAERFFDSSF